MTKDEVFALALEVASESKAKKRKVGAVLAVLESFSFRVLSAACNYNAEDPAGPCEDDKGNTLPTVVHAEVNALRSLPMEENFYDNLHLFVTHEPCANCVAAFAEHLSATTDVKARIHVVSSGMKFDDGKMRYDLIPAIATEGLAAVLTYGAKKYKPNNWRSVDPQRYVGAFERHWQAYNRGELIDSESGLPHLAHCMTNLAFLLELGHKPVCQQTIADYLKNSV
jgi:hypothetical protein